MKTNSIIIPAVLLSFFMCSSTSARETYKDVAVIINTNSATSESIGSYFAAQRQIPASHIIRVNAATTEEITNAEFESIRSQIESYLTSHSLTDSINYIVTTKGMPLKVNRGDVTGYYSPSSSVESELCLILGPYAANIGQTGRLSSPYILATQNFSRAQFGIYLVTRLDAYTEAEVRSMIDRAAQADSTVLNTGRFVFDMDSTKSMVSGTLNGNMSDAASALAAKGRLTVLDRTTEYLTNLPNVLGYTSWGSNDANAALYTDNAKPHHQFTVGSVAETYVSTSARSFEPGTVYGQSLIADLISEGVCGVKGYVYEPYSSAIANVQYAFPMYVDGYNFAESFYASSPYLSWMDVVIGDPKMRVRNVRIPQSAWISDSTGGHVTLPVELTTFTGAQSLNTIRLAWTTATESNNYGFEIEKLSTGSWVRIGFVAGAGTSNASHQYAFVDNAAAAGATSYRLKQIDRDGTCAYSKVIEVVFTSSVKEFKLNANYPNPFNPSTRVSFTVAKSGPAVLKVYNVIGQEVAVLFNGMAEAGVVTTVTFDASAQASGVYFSVLESSGSRMVQKMLLSR